MKRVQILRNRGVPIRADEEALRVRLENALEQLRNPAHFRGKITELWAQIQILKDSKRLHPTGNYEVADEAQVETIGKVIGVFPPILRATTRLMIDHLIAFIPLL